LLWEQLCGTGNISCSDAQTDVEANSSAYVPSMTEYCEPLSASYEFNSLSGPQVITGISFRPDASAGNPLRLICLVSDKLVYN